MRAFLRCDGKSLQELELPLPTDDTSDVSERDHPVPETKFVAPRRAIVFGSLEARGRIWDVSDPVGGHPQLDRLIRDVFRNAHESCGRETNVICAVNESPRHSMKM